MSDLCTSPPDLPYNKLSFLMTYLCNGRPDYRNIPLPLDTMCQQVILNTKKNSRHSETQSIRHARHKECHRIQHETLKLYSVIRCKSLIHVFFEHGIILSYDRIRSCLCELSLTVTDLYRTSDSKVLPSALRKFVFTIFVDDNVDKNSSSVDAKEHFHGTGVTVLQYPTTENPGQQRYRKKFLDLIDAEKIQECDALTNFTNCEYR